jgi:hypothetical protein
MSNYSLLNQAIYIVITLHEEYGLEPTLGGIETCICCQKFYTFKRRFLTKLLVSSVMPES